MLGSVGEGGGAATSTGSSVELRTSMLIDEVSKEELGITHCKREVFLNMWRLENGVQTLSMELTLKAVLTLILVGHVVYQMQQTLVIIILQGNEREGSAVQVFIGLNKRGGWAGCHRIEKERIRWQIDNSEGRRGMKKARKWSNWSTRLTGFTAVWPSRDKIREFEWKELEILSFEEMGEGEGRDGDCSPCQ